MKHLSFKSLSSSNITENPDKVSGSDSGLNLNVLSGTLSVVFAGEEDSIAGCCQRSPDERSQSAEGTLQHADPQRDLPHQPQQTADYRERRVQKQQQLLDGLPEGVQVFKDRIWRGGWGGGYEKTPQLQKPFRRWCERD